MVTARLTDIQFASYLAHVTSYKTFMISWLTMEGLISFL